jgi:two-component system, cell cycle sensor histidine kinase and response regulator CckA
MFATEQVLSPGQTYAGRILVVEDEALLAEEIRERLSRAGYTIVGVAISAADAVSAVDALRPDLVLMDIRLKGGDDGTAAAAAIQQRSDAAVVFLTAHSDTDTIVRATKTGPFGYVLKPFREQDLVVAIETALTRRRFEQQLIASERNYAAILASIGEGVVATDSEGRVTFMNRVAESLTGRQRAEARGESVETVLQLVAEATGQAIESPGRRAMREKATVTLPDATMLVAEDGSRTPVDDSAAPILDEQSRLIGSVIAFRDSRERRRREEALRQAEEHLRHARRMEAVGQLAGGIAHDFNNLLTVVLGLSDLLLDERDLTATQREWVDDIKKAGTRAADLTKQLLAFSRRQEPQPKTLHLGTLVSGISRILQRLMGEDVPVTVATAADLWPIYADPGQIEQVLLNLAANARDAINGAGRLVIEMENRSLTEPKAAGTAEIPRGRWVRLSVRDTGVGIDEATLARVFEPFFTTKEVGKGTGLGLATVYGIVRQSDGFITVSSRPGDGTTFEIYFPAVATEDV